MSEASNADKTRTIGRPFQPGNPGGGRPKMPDELKKAFRDQTKAALDTLVDVMSNQDNRGSERVKAAEVILDRAWGKPTQAIDANINDSPRRIDTSKLTKEEQQALAKVAILSMNMESEEPEEEHDEP